MPVDQATLDKYITEVAGDDQELAGILRERLGTKEAAATNFMRGFMRNSDYTQKTQDLAKQRASFESAQTDYENRLTQAEQEKNKVMKDLAEARISGSRATELLRTVKETYGLTDEDLPGVSDIKATERTGRVVDSTPDLDERFKSFEEKILDRVTKQLIPEISGLAILGPVWNDIAYEHEKLFGNRLTRKDQADILEQARKENRSLDQVWADKYNVSDKRMEVRTNDAVEKARRQWEDDRAKKDQEAALRGVHPEAQDASFADRQSPIFKRSFEVKDDQGGEGNGLPTKPKTDAVVERGSAADRAAAKFLQRKASGQLGKPLEAAVNA